MSRKRMKFKSKAIFTFVGGVLVINPAFAQDTSTQSTPAVQSQNQPASTSSDATTLDTVVVTGIRSSLAHAMEIKRDASGVVDAISAEDIGKMVSLNTVSAGQRWVSIASRTAVEPQGTGAWPRPRGARHPLPGPGQVPRPQVPPGRHRRHLCVRRAVVHHVRPRPRRRLPYRRGSPGSWPTCRSRRRHRNRPHRRSRSVRPHRRCPPRC